MGAQVDLGLCKSHSLQGFLEAKSTQEGSLGALCLLPRTLVLQIVPRKLPIPAPDSPFLPWLLYLALSRLFMKCYVQIYLLFSFFPLSDSG